MSLDIAHSEYWIFDLDNTLYPAECKLFHQVDIRMRNFISDYFNLNEDESVSLQKRYFREYGTTLNGLMKNHGMKPEAFLEYVHDIDVSVVSPNPSMGLSLSQLPGQKIVFTNGTLKHAQRVMERLGIEHNFNGVFDIFATNFTPKPNIEGYYELVRKFAINPQKTVMVEDMVHNLEPAKNLGMTTVLIKPSFDKHNNGETKYVDYQVGDLTAWLGKLANLISVGAK